MKYDTATEMLLLDPKYNKAYERYEIFKVVNLRADNIIPPHYVIQVDNITDKRGVIL